MFKRDDLIGLKYPIKSSDDDSIVAVRTIKKVYDVENVAGFVLQLRENSTSLLAIGFTDAKKLVEDNANGIYDNMKVLES